MKDLEVKKKVLDEIMGLMDEKDGDRLKKHPKVMAAKIEVKKPELEIEEPKESVIAESEDELSPEMVSKLLEMYEEIKG